MSPSSRGTFHGAARFPGPAGRHAGSVIWLQLVLAALVLAAGVALLVVGAYVSGAVVALAGGVWVGFCVRRL